jgi:predicted ATPase
MKKPPLRSFRVENFKSIHDSGRVDFGWLTVFIGNNGVGKSSLVEAIETMRDVTLQGLDDAFRRWRGFEHVWNKSTEPELLERRDHRDSYKQPMRFWFHWRQKSIELRFQQTISPGPGSNTLFIQREQLIERLADRPQRWTRNDAGEVLIDGRFVTPRESSAGVFPQLGDGESLLKRFRNINFERWQFLMLNPERMGQPTPQSRAVGTVYLAKDGANIAEYLEDIRKRDLSSFEGILEALRYVLPYALDLQPTLASEIERAFYLKLKEGRFDVPGWLLSTGTLRVVALLACLRHPEPPSLLIVEEIENGLDPRTLHLVVEEIRAAITAGTTQVIVTTHSPYLLDLLDISHIVVVDRKDGQPVFRRPSAEQLVDWSKEFSPGRLYTMGQLNRNLE